MRWLRSVFDKGHGDERKAMRKTVNHALAGATAEQELSRRARRKLELELEARRRER